MRSVITTLAIGMAVLAVPETGALAQTSSGAAAATAPVADVPVYGPDTTKPLVDSSWKPFYPAKQVAQNATTPPPAGTPGAQPAGCTGPVDPYKNYDCLDDYLGDDIFDPLLQLLPARMGRGRPAGRSEGAAVAPRRRLAEQPETVPPMPFTEWPNGALTSHRRKRPNSVDSPFMVAIANTSSARHEDAHIQIYGWINPGINLSSNTTRPGGNFPVAYMYTPNTVQLDQAVIYFERLPDTVQTDHIDWGFRFSGPLRRELPIYELLRHRQLPVRWDSNNDQRLRHADGCRATLYPQCLRGRGDPNRALHLDPGHRGATRTEQLCIRTR